MEAASTSLQERIDGIDYPPTHTYRLDGLVATSWLSKRMDVINSVAPMLFQGQKFLEIGCNKGFFALKAAQHCERVVGFDPVEEYVELCQDIAPNNCEFFVSSFGDFDTDETFDRIFLGNGPHYPYREWGGWGWVEKLARLSTGLVVVEGPIGMECKDMQMNNCIPEHLKAGFNRADMLDAYAKWFNLETIVSSPLVDRYVMVFRRKDDLLEAPMSRYAQYLQYVYNRMAQHTTAEDEVFEVCTRHDRGVLSKAIIPHARFLGIDKDPRRPGLNLDVMKNELPYCDVLLSTAILHHTPRKNLPELISRLAKNTRRLLMFSGPHAAVMPELFGDHEYHIDVGEIMGMAEVVGFQFLRVERVGLSKPFSEVLIVFERKP